MFKKIRITIFLILIIALLPTGISIAQEFQEGPVKVKLTDKDDKVCAEFWIRGRLIGRLPQLSDFDRFDATILNWKKRLNKIFTEKTDIKSIRARASDGKGIVYQGNTQILIFDSEMAKKAGTTPIKMAKKWAGNIRFALTKAPSFTIKKRNVIIPLNETATLHFDGNFTGNIEFYDYDPDIVTVSSDKKKKIIQITGHNLGKGMIKARAEDIEQVIYFNVMERAGYSPKWVNVEVSGNPASISLIKKALNSVIYYKSAAKTGAYTVIGKPLKDGKFKSLKPGQSLKLIIPVKVAGENYIKSVNKAHVTVENVAYKWQTPKLLLVSNKPEVIRKDGDLFKSKIKVGSPARYFYHHVNARHAAWRRLYISIENTSSIPAKIFIFPVGAGPSSDELFVGHMAVLAFFHGRRRHVGWFITLKPGTRFLLEKRLVKNSQTVSGVGYINVVEGAEVSFNVYATTIPGKLPPENVELHPEKPGVRTAKGVFPAGIKIDPTHKIGGKYTFIYLGNEPFQKDLNNGNPNYGNYGAIYDIDITVENNFDNERNAWIYFVPGGGISRGIFEIDGQLYETPLASPAQKVLLKKMTVAPGSKEKVRLVTMPQGGAYYPVKIIVESEYVKKKK
ncbi:MAG: hypothetical protein K8T10_17315 [Candidatus Eremiobacteraeota bacterium]|nr:hypothetical protein [Candidatus Eremiobacteraeota bacterium]